MSTSDMGWGHTVTLRQTFAATGKADGQGNAVEFKIGQGVVLIHGDIMPVGTPVTQWLEMGVVIERLEDDGTTWLEVFDGRFAKIFNVGQGRIQGDPLDLPYSVPMKFGSATRQDGDRSRVARKYRAYIYIVSQSAGARS